MKTKKKRKKKYCMICLSELSESMFCPKCYIERNQWYEK